MFGIFKTIKENHYLITTWVKFNIESNYIDAKLGMIWLVLEPLLQTVTYSFIFSALLGRPPRGNVPFIVFYLSGITAWQLINSSFMKAGQMMIRFNRLLANLNISAESLIIIDMAERFIEFAINFMLLVIIAALYGIFPTITYIYLPLIFLFIVLISMGGMFFLSSLGVFVRDVANITSMIMRLLFFLSGVIITPDMLPKSYSNILLINPFLHMIEALRNLTLYSTVPSKHSLLYMGAFSLLVFILGYRFFKKREGIFVDYQ